MTGCTKTGVKNAIEAIGQYQEMIDKAIEKIGISRDLIERCYYPISKMAANGKDFCDLKEAAVCIMLKPGTVSGSQIALLVFGLEGSKEKENKGEFHCKAEESRWQDLSACNDCPNKCEEWYQWDKEFKGMKK